MDNFSTEGIDTWVDDEELEEEEIIAPIVPKVDMKRLNTEIFFKLNQVVSKMKIKYEQEPTKTTYDNIILLEGIKN